MWRKICFYRCHYDTCYEKSRELNLTTFSPSKRFKSTYCPYNLNFKIFKDIPSDSFPCANYLEHIHNHPMEALQNFSFKPISDNVAASIKQLFQGSMTPSMAYNEFLKQLRGNAINELDFHIKKADRSVSPRHRNFNTLSKKYCEEEFRGKNREKMFHQLEEQINGYRYMKPDFKIVYQLFDPDMSVV